MLVLIDKITEGIRSGRKSVLNREIESVSREKAFDLVVHAALKGDQFVIELISELGYNIGQGVAILIHLLNPGQIVLSGRGASLGKLWVTSIQHAINKHCIPAIAENVEFEVSQMGADAEFIGAAALVMENIDTTALDLYPVKTNKPIPIPI
jgi:predicted NBD/HSP70 family sugar kinase